MSQLENNEKDPKIKALEDATSGKEVMEALVSIAQDKLSVKENFVLQKKVDISTKKRAAEEAALKREAEGLPPLEKIDYQFGEAAYGYKLKDYEATPRMSLELAAIDFGKDMEWVEEMKHSKWPHNKRITLDYKDEFGTFLHDDLVRSCIADATTLNSGLTVLHKFQKIDRELNQVRAEIAEMKYNQKLMLIEQAKDRIDIDTLLVETGVEPLSDADKAKLLKANGVKNKVIAERLGVHRNTIAGWLKNA